MGCLFLMPKKKKGSNNEKKKYSCTGWGRWETKKNGTFIDSLLDFKQKKLLQKNTKKKREI